MSEAKGILNLKLLVGVMLSLFLLFFVGAQANASEQEEQSFDLNNLEKQEIQVTNEEGETGVIGMEPVESSGQIGTLDLSQGSNTWRTYYDVGSLQAEFLSDITVSSSNVATIDRVYDSSYRSVGGQITGDTLSIDRATQTSANPAQATYRISYEAFGSYLSGTATLTLNVRGTNVTTSQDGFIWP